MTAKELSNAPITWTVRPISTGPTQTSPPEESHIMSQRITKLVVQRLQGSMPRVDAIA